MYVLNKPEEKINFEIKNNAGLKTIYFNSLYKTNNPILDKVKCLYFPCKHSKDSIIIVHGMGERNLKYLIFYAKKFCENGYNVILPILPYHYDRKVDDTAFLSGFTEDIEKRFNQSVSDIIACCSILTELNINTINILGFSLGGIISVISKALDNRIKKASFVVTGGNFEHITWHSIATKVLRVRYESPDSPCNSKLCTQKHKNFCKICKDFKSIDDLTNLPSCFRYDASVFAGILNKKDVIMFNALFDIFIPRNASNDLWDKLNHPKKYMLPAGHLTSHVFFKKFIYKTTLEFFNS